MHLDPNWDSLRCQDNALSLYLNDNEDVDAAADDDDVSEFLSALHRLAFVDPASWPLKCKTQRKRLVMTV